MVTENKKTISVLNASILGLILGALLVALLALPFCMLYSLKSIEQIIQFFKFQIFVPSLVIGILIANFSNFTPSMIFFTSFSLKNSTLKKKMAYL